MPYGLSAEAEVEDMQDIVEVAEVVAEVRYTFMIQRRWMESTR